VIEGSSLERWRDFATGAIGLPGPLDNADGSQGYQLDDRAQRLIVTQGPADDVAAIGLELPDEAAMSELRRRLAAAGVACTEGDATLARSRRVERLVHFADPGGLRVEAALGLAPAARPYSSDVVPAGFNTANGFGHAVLLSHDVPTAERFYCDVLGFRPTERLRVVYAGHEITGVFLHCNPRHHSVALFAVPAPRRMHHFMLEARDPRDVARAQAKAIKTKVPQTLTLGQHPLPDGTFSFYAATPSGFDYEIGAGGNLIEPEGWRERALTRMSDWGHERPQAAQ
jgi:2,3-dihydroxybiphenyl 1,2-dioxygenase